MSVDQSEWWRDFSKFDELHQGHAVVDSDCLLASLAHVAIETAVSTIYDQRLNEALGQLGVAPEQLLQAADAIRPAWQTPPLPPPPEHAIAPAPTARLKLIELRATALAWAAESVAGKAGRTGVWPIHAFQALLAEEEGPGSAALRSCGIDLSEARRTLGLPDPTPAVVPPSAPSYPSTTAPATGHTGPTTDRFVLRVDDQEIHLWAEGKRLRISVLGNGAEGLELPPAVAFYLPEVLKALLVQMQTEPTPKG